MATDGFTPSDEVEMSQRLLQAVLDDLAARSEDWMIAVSPLGDGLGFRAVLLLGEAQLEAGRCSNRSVTTAVTEAVARGLTAIEEAIEEQTREGEGLT